MRLLTFFNTKNLVFMKKSHIFANENDNVKNLE